MGWISPPSRREISLLLFSFTVFVFAYNLDITLSPHNLLFRKLGLSSSSVIGKDGRRPPGWRDQLENEIFGDWRWEEGHVAGEGPDRRRERGTDRYGAQWLGRNEIGDVVGELYGTTTADNAILRWADDPPITTMVKHVPGFTILDNAIILDGAIYIVTDDYDAFPPPTSIMTQKHGSVIEVLSKDQASSYLGGHGGKVSGVTFLSNDLIPHNATLISLWRTYSSLDPAIDSSGRTHLSPPRRLFLTRIPPFSDALQNPEDLSIIRKRSLTGFHPFLAKVAFPMLGIMHQKDWLSYHSMDVPFVFERLVIADIGIANRMGHKPPFSPPFESLVTSQYWWEPVRRKLTTYLELPDDASRRQKPVITYLSRQEAQIGLCLTDEKHNELVKELRKMGRSRGYEINIVSERTSWHERMTAIARSTIILGVHGEHLMDAIFAKPSHRTSLIEFFPDESFVRDHQILMASLGTRYFVAWSNQTFDEDTLPPVLDPPITDDIIIDVPALIRQIRDLLQS